MNDMTDIVGRPPAGDENPEEYLSNDQSAGQSPETGTTYDGTGEPEMTPHDAELVAEENQASNPNAASSRGLQGDLGVSSERLAEDAEGIEGTGSVGSATSGTEGQNRTTGGPPNPPSDESSNPAQVPSHESDRAKNPGHSHG
jgi:hypothetical protein